ncbi:MAG: hypothetical protein RIG67_13215 [Rhodospirillales bacterium]
MSLNYKIHWVDDSPDFAEAIKEDVELHFADAPINIDADIVEDGDQIEEVARSTSLDLFILDYGLDGRNGDELIKILRGSGELTEIVFYSQDDDIHKKCPEVVGVYPCQRAEAGEKIKSVITKFIDRINNIAVMRGMIISEAIEVENRLTEILLGAFNDKKDLFREKILNKAIMDFEKKRMFVQSVLKDKIKEANQSAPKDQGLLEKLNGMNDILSSMKKDIIDQRNILAHSEKTFDENGVLELKPLTKGASIKFDDDWKNTIRENIKLHMKNLYEIGEVLQ